jgi:hypothetical protein
VTAIKKRIVGHATPNEYPRSANAALLMANLAAIQAAGQHAIVELRGFGLHDLADSLLAEVEKVRVIHTAAGARLNYASTIEAARIDATASHTTQLEGF